MKYVGAILVSLITLLIIGVVAIYSFLPSAGEAEAATATENDALSSPVLAQPA